MSPQELKIERDGGVTVLKLNRPDRMNAFNETMHGALHAALEAARDDDACRCIVLTGKGRGFCAGQDLNDRKPGDDGSAPDLGWTIETFYNPLVRLIRSLEKPVVCAVNGVAAGAGANIALACDIVVAARSARFIQAFCKLGLVPDSGGTWLLTHGLGEARAKALALTGAPVSAEQAADWGMIWQVVDDERLQAHVMELARGLAEAPTFGLALTKKAIHAAAANDLDAQLDLERDLQRQAGASPDFREGVEAFLGKRKPVFTGRRS